MPDPRRTLLLRELCGLQSPGLNIRSRAQKRGLELRHGDFIPGSRLDDVWEPKQGLSPGSKDLTFTEPHVKVYERQAP